MRNEVKIGILALVAILLAFWGFKFIQGSNLFSSSQVYFVEYSDVAGLTVGTPVQISGVNIGSVKSIKLDQQKKLVIVTLEVRDNVNIPVGTRAYITTVSLLGEKAVVLEYDRPCFGDGDCAESETFLEGSSKGILASFLGTDPDADPAEGIKAQIGDAVDSLQWTLFSENSDNPIARASRDLAVTMENLKGTSNRLDRILAANSNDINTTFDNLASLSRTLSENEAAIASILQNTDSLTQNLSGLQLEQSIEEFNTTIASLRSTLDQADRAIGGVSAVIEDVQNGQGTLGKLLTSDEVYNQINDATRSADTLFNDLQERPYRYVPFKSRRRVLKFDRRDEELEEGR
ncbi:phospholipid/cholesterol/gamma-HCH transport system substrate-binding protein [Neolewinella xylanilytica]|uniref:Phospholipid/cholesterol/gamma-HCH transport system substrate-binding protein n=1 Tax=Neolewinella xylanilytica TaxID=1514080 RepID=A0A2S6I553_9BACT|nr:MlaD family protein [Neolewinella xylanilytica]PPK86259.1 phospholipid/cholesterol/gamma-HCH transport system substrate-binding protein [Neolewinella xylanilytica]